MANWPDQKDYDLHDVDPESKKGVYAFNKAHAAAFLVERDEAIVLYNIKVDDFGRAVSMPYQDARKLLHETRRCALEAMLGYDTPVGDPALREYWVGDDGCDYNNAALDQIIWCTNLITDLDSSDEEIVDSVIAAINADLDEGDHENIMGFRLGYADHGSPMSTLNLTNHKD